MSNSIRSPTITSPNWNFEIAVNNYSAPALDGEELEPLLSHSERQIEDSHSDIANKRQIEDSHSDIANNQTQESLKTELIQLLKLGKI